MANNNNFPLTLDTIAPDGTITRPSAYMNTNAPIVTQCDSGDAAYKKVWFSKLGTSDSAGEASAPWIPATQATSTAFVEDGQYYYHMVVIDDVGNKSGIKTTDLISFDNHSPTIGSVTIRNNKTNSTSLAGTRDGNTITINNITDVYPDITYCSDIDYIRLAGNFVGSPLTITAEGLTKSGNVYNYVGTITFTNEARQGIQTISIVAFDKANNASDTKTASITLDTEGASATLLLEQNTTSGTGASHTHNALAEYVNSTLFKACIDISGVNVSDVIGYKLWGDITGRTTEPTKFTLCSNASKLFSGVNELTSAEINAAKAVDPIIIADLNFTSTDGTKTVYAKIIDAAGNETALTQKSVVYDHTNPAITGSISAAVNQANAYYISEKSGYDSIVVNLNITDSPAGLASCVIKVNNDLTVYSSASETSWNRNNYTINKTILHNQFSEGVNTITVVCTDRAGNSSTLTKTVYKDCVAPTITSPTLNTWYNDDFGFILNTTDKIKNNQNQAVSDNAAGVAKFYIWATTSTTFDKIPNTVSAITKTANPQLIDSSDINWDSRTQSANNYLHIVAEDLVGNQSSVSVKFGYDDRKPVVNSANFSKEAYASTTAQITFITSDETSLVSKMKLFGDITNSNDWQNCTPDGNGTVTVPVTLTTGDGIKTVHILTKDNAGNVSDQKDITCELDTSTPVGSIVLVEDGSTTQRPMESYSSVAAFNAQISFTDDARGAVNYALYGDFSVGSQTSVSTTEQNAIRGVFTSNTSGGSTIISNLFCTLGGGRKDIYLKISDNAGNTSTVHTFFYYDTDLPTVESLTTNYSRISNVHIKRKQTATADYNAYCDEVSFTFTPSERIQAYKICVYGDKYDSTGNVITGQTAVDNARNGKPANSNEAPSAASIPTTVGSTNMSATGLDTAQSISCMIKGADLISALVAGGYGNPTKADHKYDGAHVIVIYIQDLGGNWSAAASI